MKKVQDFDKLLFRIVEFVTKSLLIKGLELSVKNIAKLISIVFLLGTSHFSWAELYCCNVRGCHFEMTESDNFFVLTNLLSKKFQRFTTEEQQTSEQVGLIKFWTENDGSQNDLILNTCDSFVRAMWIKEQQYPTLVLMQKKGRNSCLSCL